MSRLGMKVPIVYFRGATGSRPPDCLSPLQPPSEIYIYIYILRLFNTELDKYTERTVTTEVCLYPSLDSRSLGNLDKYVGVTVYHIVTINSSLKVPNFLLPSLSHTLYFSYTNRPFSADIYLLTNIPSLHIA